MSDFVRITNVDVSLPADPAVEIVPPRAYTTAWGQQGVVPWYVRLNAGAGNASLSGPRSALVALRDALTAALDAHPDDNPPSGEDVQR